MSKIVVALVMCVLLLGATLYIGDTVGTQAALRGNLVKTSIEKSKVNTDGTIEVTMP